jgi:hypothetical protein
MQSFADEFQKRSGPNTILKEDTKLCICLPIKPKVIREEWTYQNFQKRWFHGSLSHAKKSKHMQSEKLTFQSLL